jgi:biotin carboxylase
VRVLLSEASSLTAREHLSVLGPSGIRVDVASSSRLAIARFSRWCRRVVRVPCSADDPTGYLAAIAAALREGGYDALLPTHEQAWLFAAGRHLLPADAPLAVPGIEAFDQIQSKLACCRLLDALGLPQPGWSLLAAADHARQVELPCWLKASFSTAGRGVRYVTSPGQAADAYGELAAAGPC